MQVPNIASCTPDASQPILYEKPSPPREQAQAAARPANHVQPLQTSADIAAASIQQPQQLLGGPASSVMSPPAQQLENARNLGEVLAERLGVRLQRFLCVSAWHVDLPVAILHVQT